MADHLKVAIEIIGRAEHPTLVTDTLKGLVERVQLLEGVVRRIGHEIGFADVSK